MKKYIKFIIAAIIALIFIGTFVFLWMKSRPQSIVYEEFMPKVMDLKKTTVVTGKIEPRNEVNVKPQISGIITEITKEAGQTIQAGEIIAKIKVIPDMQQLSSAEARVRLAEVNVKQRGRPTITLKWCATVCRKAMPAQVPRSFVQP